MKVKTDADILALFDRVSAEVRRLGPGSRAARAVAPAFHTDQNEWSELELSGLIAAELEERRQWELTATVLARGEQRCVCGNVQTNTLGVFAKELHRNGCTRLRRPRPEDFAMLEVLERHIEWFPVEQVTNCAVCFEWGERRLQQSFRFENQGEVPVAVQELADLTVMELYGPHATAAPHQYFKEAPSANTVKADESGGEDDNDVMDTFDKFNATNAPD